MHETALSLPVVLPEAVLALGTLRWCSTARCAASGPTIS